MMTKQQVAKLLGVSTRAIERYTSANKLHVTYRNRFGGGQEAVYDPAEVSQLQEERRKLAAQSEPVNPVEAVRHDDILTSSNTTATSIDVGSTAIAILERLAIAIEKPQPHRHTTPTISLAEKLTLSLAEASTLAGLSEKWLRAAIKAGELRADKRGRGWNIKRADLETYVHKL